MKKLAFIFSVLLVAVYFANLMYTDSKEAKIKLEQMLRKTTVDKAEMDRFLPVWAEYLEDGVSRIGARQISLTMGPASENFRLRPLIGWRPAAGMPTAFLCRAADEGDCQIRISAGACQIDHSHA